MVDDVAALDRELRALILTATDLIEQEVRLLHRVALAIKERTDASMMFADRFGHLLEEPEPLECVEPAHRVADQAAFERLASELSLAIGGGRP